MTKSKPKKDKTPTPDASAKEKPPVTEETKTEETKPKETAIEKPAENAIATLGQGDPLYLERYGEAVQRVAVEVPTPVAFQQIIDALPEEYVDNLMGIIQKTMGARKGVYGDSDRPDFPELRVYHGTGNDPNRPEEQIPGQYYLTTKESVGKTFEGTVLALWGGRTMWGDADAGESTKMPICQSMDRKMGSTCGECDKCPNKPWRDGQQQRCSDDVVAFMLSRDMSEIVLVRFQKTSEPAGKQLKKYTKRSMQLWSKWYRLGLESRTAKNDSSIRWFVMNVEPCTGDDALVPAEIYNFCDAMCVSLEASFILPNMAGIYRSGQADDIDEEATEEEGGGSTPMMEKEDYGDMDDDKPNM